MTGLYVYWIIGLHLTKVLHFHIPDSDVKRTTSSSPRTFLVSIWSRTVGTKPPEIFLPKATLYEY